MRGWLNLARKSQFTFAMPKILFYGCKNLYGEFSNFWPAKIRIDGKLWPTTEVCHRRVYGDVNAIVFRQHYFQAMKFHREPQRVEEVRLAKTPGDAKKLGGRPPLRPDWEEV